MRVHLGPEELLGHVGVLNGLRHGVGDRVVIVRVLLQEVPLFIKRGQMLVASIRPLLTQKPMRGASLAIAIL